MIKPAKGEEQPTIACRFYMSASGSEPVRGWLKGQSPIVRRAIGVDIGRVEWRWPVGLPLVDGFGRGLFEVRTKVQGNIYRVFFCVEDGVMWLLHGFTKKSQKTPPGEIEIARKRQKEVEENK